MLDAWIIDEEEKQKRPSVDERLPLYIEPPEPLPPPESKPEDDNKGGRVIVIPL